MDAGGRVTQEQLPRSGSFARGSKKNPPFGGLKTLFSVGGAFEVQCFWNVALNYFYLKDSLQNTPMCHCLIRISACMEKALQLNSDQQTGLSDCYNLLLYILYLLIFRENPGTVKNTMLRQVPIGGGATRNWHPLQ